MKIISVGRKEEPLFSAGLFDVCWYRIGKTNKRFKLKTNSDFTHLFPDVPSVAGSCLMQHVLNVLEEDRALPGEEIRKCAQGSDWDCSQ